MTPTLHDALRLPLRERLLKHGVSGGASATDASIVFDVEDCKVYKLTSDTGASPVYGAAVDVPAIFEVLLDVNLLTAELDGDARIVARRGRVPSMKVSATYGKLSLPVLDVIYQGTIDTATTGKSAWVFKGFNKLPYFKFEALIADTEVGEIHLVLYKAQLTGGALFDNKYNTFGQPKMDIEGIALASNDLIYSLEFYDGTPGLDA